MITRATPRSLGKPNLTLGIPKHAITAACLLYAFALILPVNKLAALAVIGAGLAVTRLLAQFGKDLMLFCRALFQCSVYDAKMRKVQKVRKQ